MIDEKYLKQALFIRKQYNDMFLKSEPLIQELESIKDKMVQITDNVIDKMNSNVELYKSAAQLETELTQMFNKLQTQAAKVDAKLEPFRLLKEDLLKQANYLRTELLRIYPSIPEEKIKEEIYQYITEQEE